MYLEVEEKSYDEVKNLTDYGAALLVSFGGTKMVVSAFPT